MTIPTNEDILRALTGLETKTADSIESQWLEFKPWRNPKEDMKVAVEQAVCFANGEGGCVVFGVADFVVGRAKAIHGAKEYDLDMWRRSIFESTRPNLVAEISEINVPEGTGKLLVVRVGYGSCGNFQTIEKME